MRFDDDNSSMKVKEIFFSKNNIKLQNKVKVFQELKKQFDDQTTRRILDAWKENFKDFLLNSCQKKSLVFSG